MSDSSHNSMPFQGQIEYLSLQPDHVKVLSSVACTEVYASFSFEEPFSIREVAGFLDRSAASVGEQVAKLVNCGLLIQAGERKRRSRTEALYVYYAKVTRFILREQDPETLEIYMGRFRGQMRLIEREYALAQQVIAEQNDFQQFLVYKWTKLYLTPKNADKVQQAVNGLIELISALGEEAPAPGSEDNVVRATLTTLLMPTLSSSKRARKKQP